MSHDFTQEEIEEVKHELSGIFQHFVEKFRDENFNMIEEQLVGHDNCCKYRKVHSEENCEEAENQVKALFKEAVKLLKY